MFSWLKTIFGRSHSIREDKNPESENFSKEPDQPPNPDWRDPDDPAYAETHEAVEAYWNKIGDVDSDVISYAVNPMFLGAPAWPGGRQAFQIVRTKDSLIIASNGLSDPFDEDKNEMRNGFGMEVFIEVRGLQDAKFEEIKTLGAFVLIEQTARQIAHWGGMTDLLDKVTVASSEIPISDNSIPDSFMTADESVGVLFGMTAKGRPKTVPNTPLSSVRMVAVTAVTAREISEVAKSKAARDRLARQLRDAEIRHLTDFDRSSLC